MPRRAQLLEIASGLLGSFVSRNNDVGGYWALGVLYRQAQEQGRTQVEVPIWPLNDSLDDALIESLAEKYRQMFLSLMARQQLPLSWLRSAVFSLEFESSNAHPRYRQSQAAERPFVCGLSFTNDLSRTHQLAIAGWCWPHSEQREHQSTRKPD